MCIRDSRVGDQQAIIINEALLVSSVKPDKVFVRELRWAQYLFGYESRQASSMEPSSRFEDWADNGDLEIWKEQFKNYFPTAGLFPGATFGQIAPKVGPMLLQDSAKQKPDYRNPNRKIKVGDNWQRRVPQLVWFTRPLKDFEVCQKLIDEGASVNLCSESGQTPIMAALENLDLTELDGQEADDRFFWLYSEQPHSTATINIKTNKKHMLPIILAVDSGRLDVVEKVLLLGADPNLFGSVDNLTALMHCLELIAVLKSPSQAKQKMTVSLEAIKRQAMSTTGFSEQHQQEFINQLSGDEHRILSAVYHLQIDKIVQAFDIDVLRKIAIVLINNGADPNLVHPNMMGRSPMLLSAELGEADIFEAMLNAGGDPNQTYYDEFGKDRFNCWHLANHFNSSDVRIILDKYRKTQNSD